MENTRPIRIRGFAGLDTESSVANMDPRDTPDAQNVYTENGVIRKRPGTTRAYDNAPYATGSPGDGKTLWWMDVVGQYLLASCRQNTSYMKYVDAATPTGAWSATTVPSPGLQCRERFVDHIVVMGNTISGTATKITNAMVCAALAGTPPAGNTIAAYNRMMLIGSDSTSVIRFSAIDNDESWTVTDSITAWGIGSWLEKKTGYSPCEDTVGPP